MRDRFAAAPRTAEPRRGSIFVQIGDENVHLVRNSVMDEVFGSENCCGVITFQKTSGQSSPNATTNVLDQKVADYPSLLVREVD